MWKEARDLYKRVEYRIQEAVLLKDQVATGEVFSVVSKSYNPKEDLRVARRKGLYP